MLDYLEHMEEGLEVATQALADVEENVFVNEHASVRLIAFGVRAAILQIGEAAISIHKRYRAFEDAHPEVEWAKIGDMRNFLAHEYFAVDYQLIWDAVKHFMPILQAQLPALRSHAEKLEPPSSQPAYRPKP
ncbi:MAG TPA: HepT-like ribonuclease domain-containing protein [Ideonella sp.]|uniref:HepT-like ribonuclease domain-containing protein n=1 Tax=Ideonella sp. TaxID=1929293 RepID=UPI002BFC8A9D|nr:HepT-like ribonuclease domain-containing protein [Ideonella sp.]HSI50310.1 HepT-like ribonuclease domain-containing protein [Ideonella sp.]